MSSRTAVFAVVKRPRHNTMHKPGQASTPSEVLAALPSALATLTAFEAAELKRMLGMALQTLLAVALMS